MWMCCLVLLVCCMWYVCVWCVVFDRVQGDQGPVRNSCPARVNHPHEPNTVMKDNDLKYKLKLGVDASRKLAETLKTDVR